MQQRSESLFHYFTFCIPDRKITTPSSALPPALRPASRAGSRRAHAPDPQRRLRPARPAKAHRQDSAPPARPRAANPPCVPVPPRPASARPPARPAANVLRVLAGEVVRLIVNLRRLRSRPVCRIDSWATPGLTIPARPVAPAAAPRAAAHGRAPCAASGFPPPAAPPAAHAC